MYYAKETKYLSRKKTLSVTVHEFESKKFRDQWVEKKCRMSTDSFTHLSVRREALDKKSFKETMKEHHITRRMIVKHKVVECTIPVPAPEEPSEVRKHKSSIKRIEKSISMLEREKAAQTSESAEKAPKIKSKKTYAHAKCVVRIEDGKFFKSYADAADYHGRHRKSSKSLKKACQDETGQVTAYGYHWRYATEEELKKYI